MTASHHFLRLGTASLLALLLGGYMLTTSGAADETPDLAVAGQAVVTEVAGSPAR